MDIGLNFVFENKYVSVDINILEIFIFFDICSLFMKFGFCIFCQWYSHCYLFKLALIFGIKFNLIILIWDTYVTGFSVTFGIP